MIVDMSDKSLNMYMNEVSFNQESVIKMTDPDIQLDFFYRRTKSLR